MESKEDLIKKVGDLAFQYEAERGSCPQCVLAALRETLDVGDEATIKAVDALAGGTALSAQGTCGALVGGLMAISSVLGRDYKDFQDEKKQRRIFVYAQKLYDRFTEEYGSPLCKDVQEKIFGKSYNLIDPEEYKEFEKAGAHIDKCPNVSKNSARWAAELIIDIKND